ncbi:MAG: hypothetical protein DI603_15165 [Roseateles depolymerans]|uniref:Uncharacterized protein n=1 Tax=Roseateles depolymerans TaxID=76731 RepID=A0A2W5DEY1_9BURK|nr:MAG: hypothetical protein DI603_15165 [Roseateles depolymerans]
MSKTQPPAGLYEAGLFYAEQQFANRKADLKAMRKSLDLLEEVMPELRARSVAPAVGSIHWRRDSRALSFSTVFVTESVRLLEALLDLGFVETGRHDHGSFVYVELKKGRLKVHTTVYPSKAAA